MKDAMQLVKNTLGEDAIIISTREEGKKGVRLTAAIEEDFYRAHEARKAQEHEQTSMSDTSEEEDDWLHEDGNDDDEAAVIEHLTEVMLRHGVPAEVTDHVISCATVLGMGNPQLTLTAAFEHLFAYMPMPSKAYAKPLIAVGPPGAGKTLAIAKLATRAVMNDLNVAVITTDTMRAGGAEQLSAFTRILETDLLRATSAEELKAHIQSVQKQGAEQILVDTAGLNPFEAAQMRELSRLLSIVPSDPILVLPAGGDARESGEMARAFATLGVRRLLPSRIDIARRFGGLIEAAHQGGLSFTDASHTSKVADGLKPVTPDVLSGLFMPRPKSTQSNSSSQKNKSASRQTRKTPAQ